MPITVTWSDQDRNTVICTFTGEWTWNEAHVVLQELTDMVAEKEQVNLITVREQTRLHSEEVLDNLRRLVTSLPHNVNMVVMVGASVFAKMMVQVIGRVVIGPRVMFADTLEEAHRVIAEHQRHV